MNQIIKSIKANKLFTFLMMLGLFISTFSISSIIIVGNGAKYEIIKVLKGFGFGYDSILILAGPGKMFSHQRKKTTTLKLEDCKDLKRLYFVKAASPIVRRFYRISTEKTFYTSYLMGVYPIYSKYHDVPVEIGRFISWKDIRNKSKVCVIGHTICKKLFNLPPEKVIGRFIKIKNVYFKVIGVYKQKGSSKRFDLDNRIFIPLTTYTDILFHINYLNAIKLIVINAKNVDKYIPEIRKVLRKNHKLPPDRIDDFRLITSVDIIKFVNRTTNQLTKILFLISIVSFIVSGLTIMNIMLTIIYRRIKEIGIKRAFGATKKDILILILIETVFISMIGAITGTLFSVVILIFLSKKIAFPVLLTYEPFLISTLFAITVGIIFGLLPAKKASNFDPIKAIILQ